LEQALGKTGQKPGFSSKSKETVPKAEVLEQPHMNQFQKPVSVDLRARETGPDSMEKRLNACFFLNPKVTVSRYEVLNQTQGPCIFCAGLI
jgi:hypothetical protein